MSRVIAIVPARAGSKGIPKKNFTPLAGISPVRRAIESALIAGLKVWLSTDADAKTTDWPLARLDDEKFGGVIQRPAVLAQDDTPMLAVVQHALEQIPGEPDDLILLVQPTQPLRQPKHLTQAIELLQSTQADSVVSVMELPLTHSPLMVCNIDRDGYLHPWIPTCEHEWKTIVSRRQEARPTYLRDGTVYAFWRRTVDDQGNLYGRDCRPLIIPPEETCPLDTPEDWAEAERRLRAREG